MTMQTSKTKSQAEAAAKFAANVAAAQELLAKLQAHMDNHMGADPEGLHWGDVGDSAHMLAGLRNLATTFLPEE